MKIEITIRPAQFRDADCNFEKSAENYRRDVELETQQRFPDADVSVDLEYLVHGSNQIHVENDGDYSGETELQVQEIMQTVYDTGNFWE